MSIREITIFCEHESGSSLAELLIHKCLNIKTTIIQDWGELDESNFKNTLYIILVRNPFYWLQKMYASSNERIEKKKDFQEYLNQKWNHENEKARNIIDLRIQKYMHWISFKENVHHLEIIQIENIKDALFKISKEYAIGINANYFMEYRKPENEFDQFEPFITREIREYILDRLDKNLEYKLGYDYRNAVTGETYKENYNLKVMSVIGKSWKKIAIVMNHPCFVEWQNRLKPILDEMFENVYCLDKYLEKWDEDTLYFLFSVHSVKEDFAWPKHFIILQTEVFPGMWFDRKEYKMAFTRCLEVWDYSKSNVLKVCEKFSMSNYYHVAFPDKPPTISHKTRDIDILFAGSLGTWQDGSGKRRIDIVNRITQYYKKIGKHVQVVDGVYGEAFLELLQRCKVVLNVHFYFDQQPLEQSRVIPSLEQGTFVVSEHVSYPEEECVQSDRLVFCYEFEMIDKITEILENYNELVQTTTTTITMNPGASHSVRKLQKMSTFHHDNLPLLGLHMIVRDEIHNLRYHLPDIIKLFDLFVFVDTGSSDDTIPFLHSFCRTLQDNQRGYVVQRKWNSDFRRSRNESYHLCRGRSQYAMTLDAHDTLIIRSFTILRESLRMQKWHQANFSIRYQDDLCYKRPACAVSTQPLFFKYRLHEVMVPNYDMNIEKHLGNFDESVTFIECKRKGFRAKSKDKVQEDIRILKECIEQESKEDLPRYLFYLATTYFDMGDYENALNTYERFLSVGWWHEEIYVAMWRIGICYCRLDKPTNVRVDQFMKAYYYYPDRVEALCTATEIFEKAGRHREAYNLGIQGLGKPWKNTFLFSLKHYFDYRLSTEVATCAFYCNLHEYGSMIYSGIYNMTQCLPQLFSDHDKKQIQHTYKTFFIKYKPRVAIYVGNVDIFVVKHLMKTCTIIHLIYYLQIANMEILIFCKNGESEDKIPTYNYEDYDKISAEKQFECTIVFDCFDYFSNTNPSSTRHTYLWIPNDLILPNSGLLERLLPSIDRIVVSSDELGEKCVEKYHVPMEKTKVIFPGVTENIHDLKKTPFTFVWIEILCTDLKNTIIIFESFCRNHPELHATLHIYTSETVNSTDNIFVYSEIVNENTIHQILADKDILLDFSNSVAFPHCLLYALRAGVIVFSPSFGLIEMQFSNGTQPGILIESDKIDNDEYITQLSKFVDEYKNVDILRKKAVDLAISYSYENMADRWLTVLTHCDHII